MALNASDFTSTADPYGYKLFYKGRPIGGAGVLNRNTKTRVTASSDRSLFKRSAGLAIASLVDGRGPQYMIDEIKMINQSELN